MFDISNICFKYKYLKHINSGFNFKTSAIFVTQNLQLFHIYYIETSSSKSPLPWYCRSIVGG